MILAFDRGQDERKFWISSSCFNLLLIIAEARLQQRLSINFVLAHMNVPYHVTSDEHGVATGVKDAWVEKFGFHEMEVHLIIDRLEVAFNFKAVFQFNSQFSLHVTLFLRN